MNQVSWRNWSGSVAAAPVEIAAPPTEEELARLVSAHSRVRAAGAGHSFMPLCETDGLLLRLDRMEGEIRMAEDGQSAWVPAGWSLAGLTEALWRHGCSLANQGDVNPQSLAGALATGTHGTGAGLGCLSTIARGFRLMLADGSVVSCNRTDNAELFEAQRLSLGLLGIALEIEIDLVPGYHLTETIRAVPFDELVESWDELAACHRHVEFWLFPYSDKAILKTLDACDPCPPPGRDTDMGEAIFKASCAIARRMPVLIPPMQRLMMRLFAHSQRRGPAYAVFPSERTTRFEEMEYELPRENGMTALQAVVERIRERGLPVTFPFEYRLVAGDDIWLSPFHAGPCAAISMHQYAGMEWRAVFAEAEPIFRAHGGRPHWAKRHTLGRRDLAELYPRLGDFLAVRERVDPAAKFTNDALAAMLGIGRETR